MASVLEDTGVKVVMATGELKRALEEILSQEELVDIEMMAAAKKKPSTEPASDKKSTPTFGEEFQCAKLQIFDENRNDFIKNLNSVHSSISIYTFSGSRIAYHLCPWVYATLQPTVTERVTTS